MSGIKAKKIRYAKRAFLCSLFFMLRLSLGAQETERPEDYRIDAEGNLVQILRWSRTNAYFFVVEIEVQNEKGEWVSRHKERTEETSVEIILVPGMYRWRVLSYNVLERVAASSEWEGLRIYPALDPVITGFDPPAYFMDSRLDEFTLTVRGRNFTGEAKVHLAAKSGRSRPWEPVSIERGEDSVTAVFPVYRDELALGEYEIVITNPGGLVTSAEGFKVTFERPVDFTVSLAFTPALPLSGSLFKEYDRPFYPLGFSGRFGVIPFKRLWGSIGGELAARFVDLATEDDRFTLNGQMLLFSANAVYQRWFRDYTMNVNFRLGAGFAPVLNMRFDHNDGTKSEQFTPGHFTLSLGGSWQWFLWRDLFVETGLDYTQFLTGPGAPAGVLSFTIGAGWRFGKKGRRAAGTERAAEGAREGESAASAPEQAEGLNQTNTSLAADINRRLEERNISGATATVTSEGVMINVQDIAFLPDSAVLADSEKTKLDEISRILSAIPGRKIQVAGHTARAGSVESQQQLSLERAQSVAAYLVRSGARTAGEIISIGCGADRPVADNAAAEGRAQNRRVEITILDAQ
jgi:outer membrane protein OmpA-like peptidoglycan-associated protein